MAASIPGDGVPGKLERARSSLHTLAGSALLIGSTVMRPDNTAEELPKDRAFEVMFSEELGRAMFGKPEFIESLPEDPDKETKFDSVLGKNTPVSRASWKALTDAVSKEALLKCRAFVNSASLRLAKDHIGDKTKAGSEGCERQHHNNASHHTRWCTTGCHLR